MVIFSNWERVDMVMLYGVTDGNARLANIYISGTVSSRIDLMAPLSLKLTIVAVIGPKEYCQLKNKF